MASGGTAGNGKRRTMLMVLTPRFFASDMSCLPSTLLAAFCSRYSPWGTSVNCGEHMCGQATCACAGNLYACLINP